MKNRFCMVVVAAICAAAIALGVFYWRYEALSDEVEARGYSGSAANAVKHTLAAADLYGFFQIFLPHAVAEKLILSLGVANEYAERVVKASRPDDLREIIKDMHNNYAGTILAPRLSGCTAGDRLSVMLKMADDHILVVSRDKNRFYSGETFEGCNVVACAARWLDMRKPAIKERIDGYLEKESCRAPKRPVGAP